jgi:YVTN family beta-propeller protein
VDFRILGPLEVTDQGREPAIATGKQRALLAILLLHANEVVSSDRLIEELWGDQPPASAAKSLQVHVSRLRSALQEDKGNGPDSVVVTRGGGYLIRVGPGQLDLERFERLLEEGSGALADGAPERALQALREALALWRGPPLAEFAYEAFAQSEIPRLEEVHLTAVEQRIEAELALGRHAQLIGELESLVNLHPFRERLHAQLMLALYRAGRQTEALQAYQHARRTLVDEVGIEPGQPLRELERAILAQDAALDPPAAAKMAAAPEDTPTAKPPDDGIPQRQRRPGRAIAAAALPLAALAVAAGVVLLSRGSDSGGSAPLTDDSHAVAVIDPSSMRVTRAASVGTNPGPLAFEPESRSLWVGNLDDRSVTRIDVRPVKTGRTIPVRERPEDLAAGGGAVWVAGAPRTKPYVTARRIDARFDTTSAPVQVESLPDGSASVSLAGRALWVAPSAGRLTRLNAATGETAGSRIEAGATPSTVAAGRGAVWVGDAAGAGVVSRVDAGTGIVDSIPVAGSPAGIALGAGAVWVTLDLEDAVARVDPATGAVRSTTPVGQGPSGIAVGAGGVWVANSGDGTVTRLDPRSGRVTNKIPVGASPQDVVVADGRVWVSVRPRAPVEAAPGGTIRIETPEALDSVDPALAYGPISLAIVRATCAKLLDYPGGPGGADARPAPELAEALPRRSDGGRTYTFAIRRGFRFSPPSDELVTARSLKYTIERSLNPHMQSPASGLVRDLVGGSAYAEGRARHISGVRASGNMLTLRLVKPSSSFLQRIALSFFCAVPEGTPIDAEGLPEVPSAGPYYIASHVPDEEIVLRRNPNYGGSHRGAANDLRITLGVSQEKTVARIEAGTIDYTPITDNPRLARRLQERYGRESPNVEARNPRYVVQPMVAVDYLVFNTSRPPFSSARLRRAVNYALDRRALAREGLWNGLPAQPTDQYLPPTMPGYRDARIYPVRPDVARARRLAGPRRRSVILYTAGFPYHLRFAEIVKVNLRAIGLDVEIKNVGDSLFTRIDGRGEPFDMAVHGWASDYPDPTDVLSQLDGRTIREDGNINVAYFDDPAYNRRLDAATGLPSPARELALGKLDVDVARTAAPWAPVANDRTHDFFSARVGCQRYNALYGVELTSLCVRRD